VDGIPAVIEVNDGLGQTTRLELHDLERNVSIDPQRFEFSPPPEADVIAPPEYDGPGS
jgi:outer membrane lipoprotein carrier protein